MRVLYACWLSLLVACGATECSEETPNDVTVDDETQRSDQTTDDTARSGDLRPVPDYNQGCSTDDDCVIEDDPCGRAFAVHVAQREEFNERFEGRHYRCAQKEYPAEPTAKCEDGTCVGYVPEP